MSHKTEISDELFEKARKIKVEKKLNSIGSAIEYYIIRLETA
jgi:hypothetical protein